GALAPPPFPFPGGVPGRTEPPDARPASGATPEARGVVPADGATWHCGKGLQALPHSEIPNGALQVSMGISFGMARRTSALPRQIDWLPSPIVEAKHSVAV